MSHLNKAIDVPRNDSLNQNATENNEKMPLIVTFKRTIPDLEQIFEKNWHILQIESTFKNNFEKALDVAFKKNKNLHDFIGGNKRHKNENVIYATTFDKGKCHPCLTRTINLYCKQIM